MPVDRDRAYLLDITQAAERVHLFTNDMDKPTFLEDEKTQSAVIYQLLLMGEAVKRLSRDLRERHSDIPWSLIAGMRDNLIHEYHNTDFDEVWNTARRDIPALLKLLKPLLDSWNDEK